MEAGGLPAAGHRGALPVPAAGALRRRARDPDDGTRCCRRCGWRSTTRSCAARDERRRRDRAARCTPRSTPTGRPCRLPDTREGPVSHEGARHRRRRLHRLAPRRAAAATAAPTVIGIDCFTDYYPRPIKEAQPRGAAGARPGSRFVETSIQDADLGALLDGVTHVFHLAAQAGVRKSWGTRLPDLHGQQHRRDAGAARGAASGGRSSGSCTPRARRSTATTRRSRCARTRCRSRCRRTA